MNTKIIKLDLNRRLYDKIIAKQGDTKSRFLLFQLLDGSIAFNLTNRSVRAYMVKPDGKEIFNDLIINNYSLGYCTLELTNQVLAVEGTVKIELMVTEEDRKLTSSVFELEVIKSINSEKSIVSTNEFTALLNGLSSLSEYDNYKNEIAAARDGEVNLLTKVKKIDEQLEQNTKQIEYLSTIKLISDIDGTDYKEGDVVDVDQIIKLQQIAYSKIMRILKKNENALNELVNIICRGDSLTYGYDTTSSDKRPSVNKQNDNGVSQNTTIASITYPEALYEVLTNVFNKNVTVENLGISGTTCEGSYNNYFKARKNSLEIILLGTNDSRNTNYEHYGDIERFINYYEQLIIRSTLWGNAIIMVQPPSNQYMRDLNIETYRVAIKKLAEKYCITLIDASEITNTLDYTHWSDLTHFTGKGYRYLGYEIANAIILQDINQPLLIQSNSVILTRPTEDSCKFFGNASYSMSTSGYTPFSFVGSDGETPRRGIGKYVGDGKIVYTFKTTEDNLIVMPTVFCQEGTQIKVTLDHGIQQSCAPLSTSQYEFTSFDNNRPSEVTLEGNGRLSKYDYRNSFDLTELLIINSKGWHSLTIEVVSNSILSTSKYNILFGIEFLSFEDWYNMKKYNRYDTLYHSPNIIGTPTPEGTNITLSKNISDYDFLIVSYNYFGVENKVVDFKINTTQQIRSMNINNEEGKLDVAFNEVAITKVDETTILVAFNKALRLTTDESSNLKFYEVAQEYLSEIRTIKGVKV